MEAANLKAMPRNEFGKKAMRRLRATGMLPGIIYGHKETPEAITLSAHDLDTAITHGAHLVGLEMGGKTTQYLLKDIQFDHLGTTPIHVDLARVDLDERVEVKVPIVLRGEPKGVHEGGTLDQQLIDLNIECVVTQIPGEIRIMVDHLGLGEAVHVKEVKLPEGVLAQHEPDEVVCVVRAAMGAEEEAAEEGEEGSAEPEVISRGKETSEEESDKG